MSDDVTPDEPKRKKKSGEDAFVAENAVEPVPKRKDFFEWLEELFNGEAQFPERLEVRVVRGKDCATLGPKLMEKNFPAGSAKPTKGWLINWSNKVLHHCQADCDVQRKTVVYQIAPIHFSRDDAAYERFLVRCQPGATYKHGLDGEQNTEDEDNAEGKFVNQVMRHQEKMVELLGAAFESFIDRQDRLVERQYSRIEALESRWEKTMDMVERAASQEAERESRRKWDEAKIATFEKGRDMVFPLVPPIIGALTGKQVPPSMPGATVPDTPEAITLRNFMLSLQPAQVDTIFGVYDGTPENKLVKEGILSYEQSMLLRDIATCVVSLDQIDDLIGGGRLEITMDQVQRIMQAGVGIAQLAPLKIILDARQNKKNGK